MSLLISCEEGESSKIAQITEINAFIDGVKSQLRKILKDDKR